jgi:hypothetical protein
MRAARFSASGSLAGAGSALVFAWVHDIFISNIWFSLAALLVAGAVCGMCIGWTYGLLVASPSAGSWLGYNALFVVMLGLLGLVSVLVFEPVTTIAALIAANGPPGELFGRAMPMTAAFTIAMAALISRVYARTWSHFAAVLLTCSVLVLLLGLNISAIGLVEVPSSSVYLILELFGLVLALNLVYAAVFIALEHNTLRFGSRREL